KRLKKKNVTLITEATAKNVDESKDGVKVTYEAKGKEEVIEADYVLVTVGRRPNTDELGLEQVGIELDDRGLVKIDEQCRTNVDNIYAIGDIVPGQSLARKASYKGNIAAQTICVQKSVIDDLGMPAVVFADVEIARVGHADKSVEEADFKVKAYKIQDAANGSVLSLGDTDGILKLITREEDGLVVGA